METMIIPYTGQELSEFCGNFGYSRITGESDWSLRKRFFVKTFTSSPELAVEILFGTKTSPEDFTGADRMMYVSLFAGANHEGPFTEAELQKYVSGFNVDPLALREGSIQPSVKTVVESVDYKTLSKGEFKKRLIAIITSSGSKREIKDRIRTELQYSQYSVTVYYGTLDSSTAVLSGSGVKVVTTQMIHPEGSVAIGWD